MIYIFNPYFLYRSHSILTVYVESKVTFRSDTITRSELRLGKLHLIDLASSERLAESKAEGDVAKDTQNINRSLLALGEVLHALSLNASHTMRSKRSFNSSKTLGSSNAMHIPYYNSKLTHLLKDSLGGNSKTVMIANIGSELVQYHYTLYSLMYGSRAMKVRNFPRINRVLIPDIDILTDLTNERDIIAHLKLKLMSQASSNKSRIAQKYIDVAKSRNPSSPNYHNVIVTDSSLVKSNAVSNKFSSPNVSNSTNKALTLKLQTITAQKLQYVAFPLCPILKIRVAHQEVVTAKRIYVHSIAVFSEIFELEIQPDEYEEGLTMEIEAVNISASTGIPVPVGEGYFEIIKSLLPINKQTILTTNISDSNSNISGYVKMSAILLDRPVKMSVFSPAPVNNLLSFDVPLTPTVNAYKNRLSYSSIQNGLLNIRSILCFDLILNKFFSKTFGIFNGKYSVSVQIGKEIIHSNTVAGERKGRGPNSTVLVSFDHLKMSYDVNFDELDHTSIILTVFDASLSSSNCIGRANASLFSLKGRNDSIHSLGSEFVMLLYDESNNAIGKVSLCLHISKTYDTNSSSFLSPNTTSVLISPQSKILQSQGMAPILHDIQISNITKTGWIHFKSIKANNLNRFRLVGNTAKFKNIRDDPVGSPVLSSMKQSALTGKQDPFIILEIENFWCSHSEVLLNQNFNCEWNHLNTSCYLSNVSESSHSKLKILVYDCGCEGFRNIFLGSAFISLTNLIDLSQSSERTIEVSIIDNKGKSNGKLKLNYSFIASNENEEWRVGIVKDICGDGFYNIAYDDGENEYNVCKDRMNLETLSMKSTQALRTSFGHPRLGKYQYESYTESLCHSIGSKVEINDQGRGLWFPATIVKQNQNGTFDVDSEYDIIKHDIKISLIRSSLLSSRSVSPIMRSLSRPTTESNRTVVSSSRSPSPSTSRTSYEVDQGTPLSSLGLIGTLSASRFSSPQRLSFDQVSVHSKETSTSSKEDCNSTFREERKMFGSSVHFPTKFNLNDNVKVNYRGSGNFINAIIKYIHPNSCLYDVKYSTGETDLDISEDLIRSDYAPINHPNNYFIAEVDCNDIGIWQHNNIKNISSPILKHSLQDLHSVSMISCKPFFKIGDKVKVCNIESLGYIPELQSLSLIISHIKEERINLKNDRKKVQEYMDNVKFGIVEIEEKVNKLEIFKKEISYIAPTDDADSKKMTEIISLSSLHLLNQIKIAIVSRDGDSYENYEEALSPMEHIICKATILAESAGYIARIAINNLLRKFKYHQLLSSMELSKADYLSESRKCDEMELRNISTLEFMDLFHIVYNKAESELKCLQVSRNFIIENISILENVVLNKESISRYYENAYESGKNVYDLHFRGESSFLLHEDIIGDNVEQSIRFVYEAIPEGSELHFDYSNLCNALLHLKQVADEFIKLKRNVEHVAKTYIEVNDELEYVCNEIKYIKETNQVNERDLPNGAKLSADKEYETTIETLELYESKINSNKTLKLASASFVENASSNRSIKEKEIISLATKRVTIESNIRIAISNGDLFLAKEAMHEVIDIAEKQVIEIIAAKVICQTEIEKYKSMKELIDDELRISISMKTIVSTTSDSLTLIVSNIKKQDYQLLKEIKKSSVYLEDQYNSVIQMLSISKNSYNELLNFILVEYQALKHIKIKMKCNAMFNNDEINLIEAMLIESAYYKERLLIDENILQLSLKRKLEVVKINKAYESLINIESESQTFNLISTEEAGAANTYSCSERTIVTAAISYAQARYDALIAAKDIAIDESKNIEIARNLCEKEFKALSNSNSFEINQLQQKLVSEKSIAECSHALILSKCQVEILNMKFVDYKNRNEAKIEELDNLKLKCHVISDALKNNIPLKSLQNPSHRTNLDISIDNIDNNKIKYITEELENSPSSSKSSDMKSIAYDSSRSQAISETLAETAALNSTNSKTKAQASAMAQDREESIAKQAILNKARNQNISSFTEFKDTDICTALFVATIHSDVQVDLLNDAISYLEEQHEHLITAIAHAEDVLSIMTSLVNKHVDDCSIQFIKSSKEYDLTMPALIRLVISSQSSFNDTKSALDDEISNLCSILNKINSYIASLFHRKNYSLELYREYNNVIQLLRIEESKLKEFCIHKEAALTKGMMAAQEKEKEIEIITKLRKSFEMLSVKALELKDILFTLSEMKDLITNIDTGFCSVKEFTELEYQAYSEATSYAQKEFNSITSAKEYAHKALAILLDGSNFINMKSHELDSSHNIKLLAVQELIVNVTQDLHVLMEERDSAEKEYNLLNEDIMEQYALLEESINYNKSLSEIISNENFLIEDHDLINILQNIQIKLSMECNKVNQSMQSKELDVQKIVKHSQKNIENSLVNIRIPSSKVKLSQDCCDIAACLPNYSVCFKQSEMIFSALSNELDNSEYTISDCLMQSESQLDFINQTLLSIREEIKSWKNATVELTMINNDSISCQIIAMEEKRLLLKIKNIITIQKTKISHEDSSSQYVSSYDIFALSIAIIDLIFRNKRFTSIAISLAEITNVLSENDINTEELMELLHQFLVNEEKGRILQYDRNHDINNLDQSTVRSNDDIADASVIDDVWNSLKINADEKLQYYKMILDLVKLVKLVFEKEYSSELIHINKIYELLTESILQHDKDLIKFSKMKSKYFEFTTIMNEIQECNEPLIAAIGQVKLSNIPKVEALAMQKYKTIEEYYNSSSFLNQNKQSMEDINFNKLRNETIKIALEFEKDEMIAWDETVKMAIEELRYINIGIKKASLALNILKDLKVEQSKEEDEEKRKLIKEIDMLKISCDCTLLDTEKHFENFQEMKSIILMKVEELPDESNDQLNPITDLMMTDTKESLLSRINSYHIIQKLQYEIEDDQLILDLHQRKLSVAVKTKHLESIRTEDDLNVLLEERDFWLDTSFLVQYELNKLLNNIEKAKEIISLLDKMQTEQLHRERLALFKYVADAENLRAEYDEYVSKVTKFNRIFDDDKFQIFILDGDLPYGSKTSQQYQDFCNLYDEIKNESILSELNQNRVSVASNAVNISIARQMEEKSMKNANEKVIEFENIAQLCSSNDDICGALDARLEVKKWTKVELQALSTASLYAIDENDAWNNTIAIVKSELSEIAYFVTKSNFTLKLLEHIKIKNSQEGDVLVTAQKQSNEEDKSYSSKVNEELLGIDKFEEIYDVTASSNLSNDEVFQRDDYDITSKLYFEADLIQKLLIEGQRVGPYRSIATEYMPNINEDFNNASY